MMRVLSLGAGHQSTAVYLLAANGEIPPIDHAVFADTGDKTAWFMLHRVRYAMEAGPMKELLKGTVEVDETYVGGKSKGGKRGRGAPKKTPVVALVQREGGIKAQPVQRVDADSLKGEIRKHVHPDSRIFTDGLSSYQGLEKEFAGGHETVNHSDGEYARRSDDGTEVIHTNTVESFFALMKRGHYGVYHQMSKRHLHRYCAEFTFRWDHRKVSDGIRTDAAIRGASGKRLRYS